MVPFRPPRLWRVPLPPPRGTWLAVRYRVRHRVRLANTIPDKYKLLSPQRTKRQTYRLSPDACLCKSSTIYHFRYLLYSVLLLITSSPSSALRCFHSLILIYIKDVMIQIKICTWFFWIFMAST